MKFLLRPVSVKSSFVFFFIYQISYAGNKDGICFCWSSSLQNTVVESWVRTSNFSHHQLKQPLILMEGPGFSPVTRQVKSVMLGSINWNKIHILLKSLLHSLVLFLQTNKLLDKKIWKITICIKMASRRRSMAINGNLTFSSSLFSWWEFVLTSQH